MYRSAVNQQQVRGQGPPQVPQNGPVMYGSGLVFGGTVYPVLVDGVPMQPPAGAHQAAVQQRMQMQQRLQGPHSHQTDTKSEALQRAHQRLIEAPVGTAYSAEQTQPLNHRSFGRFPGATAAAASMTEQQALYNNQAVLQRLQQLQLQQQLRQAQQLAAMRGSFGSWNFNYNQQPSEGGDCSEGWNGYAMMQPSNANKPYTLGWSSCD